MIAAGGNSQEYLFTATYGYCRCASVPTGGGMNQLEKKTRKKACPKMIHGQVKTTKIACLLTSNHLSPVGHHGHQYDNEVSIFLLTDNKHLRRPVCSVPSLSFACWREGGKTKVDVTRTQRSFLHSLTFLHSFIHSFICYGRLLVHLIRSMIR